MARINTVNKSRKEQRCGACGKIIPVGSRYQYIDFYSGRHVVRCTSCGFKKSETTENSYLSQLYSIQENYEKRLNELDSNSEDTDSILDDLTSELEELRDELQDRFDNIPEQLQDGDAGQLLQERIDSIDSAISDIEGEEIQSFDDWREDNGYGEDDFESWCEENGYCDEPEEDEDEDEFNESEDNSNLEDHREDFDAEAEEKYKEYLEDISSTIQDYLGNISE